MQLVLAALTDRTTSIYQYGQSLKRINDVSSNINELIASLESLEPRSREGTPRIRAFLTPLLFRCQRDFQDGLNERPKIVFVADGFSSYGNIDTVNRLAGRFLPPNGNGTICTVQIGNPESTVLDQITHDPSRVVYAQDYIRLNEVLIDVVSKICDLP